MPINYLPELILKIDGAPASAALMEDVLHVTVEESLHLPGMFTLVIKNDYYPGRSADIPWVHESLFEIGKAITIGFAESTTLDPEFSDAAVGTVLEGEITAIETHFTSESQAPIVVRGYDVSHRLHRGRYSRSFQNMTDTDIVKSVIGEAGISPGTIDASGGPHGYNDINDANGYVFQQNQTNMEFLRERAARLGFELFVQDSKLHFRKPVSGDSLSLVWLEDITSFRVRVSSAEQVSSVEVRAWDYSAKAPIVSTKTTAQEVTSTGSGKGSASSTKFSGSPKMIVVNQAVYNSTEADAMAQALCNELGGEFVYADATAVGDPAIRVGKLVKLEEMGKKYSGSYYITEARHIFASRVYTTEFSVRGLRGGDLLATLSPKVSLQPGQTHLVGIVTDNKDPKKWGRVRVKFPTMTEEHNSYWARIVATGAGINRGFDCLPEINDEVLVGFENGDIHRPFVLGGVWNGTDAPPESVEDSINPTGKYQGKVRLRTFKTRTGHKFQFVEEDKDASKVGVYLDTVYTHKLYLNDTDKFIEMKTKEGYYARLDDTNMKAEVKTKDGHYVLLDDKNKKVEVKTTNGHVLTMDDTGRKITMTSIGDIEIAGAAANSITLKIGSSTIVIDATSIELKASSNSIKISPTGITSTVGGSKVDIGMGTLDVKSVGMLTVDGSMTTVKASGITIVQGSLVKIN